MNAPPHPLIADIVVPLAAVEATRAQAALFESSVWSRTDTGHCARASRPVPCLHARPDGRAAPSFPKDNPRLRLREVSKGWEFVEIVIASHDTPPVLWLDELVRAVGFEPTTSWFQARSAAGLRYALKSWTIQQDSNLRPPGPQPGALLRLSYGWIMAPEVGLEPTLSG
jgi:hypothetical protein